MFLDSNIGQFCAATSNIWGFFGRCLLVFKIIIPVILIVLGVIGLGKAVIADDDKEIKTQTTKLIKKLIVGVCIFFIPTLVTSLLTLVGNLDGSDNGVSYAICVKCVAHPGECPEPTEVGFGE